MGAKALYKRYRPELEDFWGRREYGPAVRREFTIFGRKIQLTSNSVAVLPAVEHSLPLYSTAPPAGNRPYSIHIVARPAPVDLGPSIPNLFDQAQYTGHGTWLAIQFGAWGHCHIDLARKHAVAVLVPALAERPESVSRYLLNTILTNFFLDGEMGMIHATGLWRDGRLLVLLGPHNSGKSTTALRLVLAGYRFLSDSQIYVEAGVETPWIYGFPVGRVKLRPDVLTEFPELQRWIEHEPVRQETKYRVDLQQVKPDWVQPEAVLPEAVELCLLSLSRTGRSETVARPATREEVLAAAVVNSLYYDSVEVWHRNLAHIEGLVARSRCHHLELGTDQAGLIKVVDSLWM